MKKKSLKKSRANTVTIRVDDTDSMRLRWLQAFLGGGNASSALKFALKAAYEQQKALQRQPKLPVAPLRDPLEVPHRPCVVAGCEKMAIIGCFACADHNEEHG